ncbi:MAG TPA: hypothetical protein VFC46_04155, partial [Humisphaera sp.]|nr:hypothetical protein [Humisphaera sp.]
RVMHGNNPMDERYLPSEWDFVAIFDERGTLARHNMLPVFYAWDTRDDFKSWFDPAPSPVPVGTDEVK